MDNKLNLPSKLQEVKLIIISDKACQKALESIDSKFAILQSTQLCAGAQMPGDDADACKVNTIFKHFLPLFEFQLSGR